MSLIEYFLDYDLKDRRHMTDRLCVTMTDSQGFESQLESKW